MPFAAKIVTTGDTGQAVEEICTVVQERLAEAPDLALVFFSPHHLEQVDLLHQRISEILKPKNLLGCVGESIIGNGREVEEQPAISLWAASWRSAIEIEPFHLTFERTADGPSLFGWPDGLEAAYPATSSILLLGDPFSLPADLLLDRLNADKIRAIGGMASGLRSAGECRLLLNDSVHEHGAVGVLLRGATGIRSIVSQGCRPIGKPYVITKAEDNVILSLGGRSPLELLQEIWQTLPTTDRQLLQHGLHVGRVINEYQSEFQRGDFLIRNVMGLDRSTGALAITERVRVGQTVQFHVRDASAAHEDLHALLQLDLSAHAKRPAAGLVFSCNGRGSRMFSSPNHDAGAVRAEAGDIPLAGFFAQGELGPVGGQNFLHGFTASIVLFEE